ncbi:MAG: replicative DNA helicase, partial [Gammaproteobacteria bacterium]|nr:replicative DNA helicase [Gammaproteobacteria bacterium]
MEERAFSRRGGESSTEVLKVPPQSIEAEQSVLGGLLLDNTSFDRIADRLGADDFYRREHRLIFSAIAGLCQESSPADVVTVAEYLEKRADLENAGGLAYLGTLANNTPSTANIVAYAAIVRERAILRRLIHVSGEISATAYNLEGRSAQDVLDRAEERILEISEIGHRRGTFQPLNALLSQAVDRIDRLFRSESPLTGVPTGFTDIDNLTSGLQGGDLV